MADNNIEISELEEDQIIMRNEWRRVSSFATFPYNISVSTIRLAQSGFYYTGRGGLCRCNFCGYEQSEWTQESLPFHCDESFRSETDEPINHEIDGHFSPDNNLSTQLNQSSSSNTECGFYLASTHSFIRLWEGIGASYQEPSLDSNPSQNHPDVFQMLRIETSDCPDFNVGQQPHLRESNSNIYRQLRICEETNSRFLSSENSNVTSNQSTREMIESEFSITEGNGISSQREENNQLSQKQTSRVLHPSIKYFCNQKKNDSVNNSNSSKSTQESNPIERRSEECANRHRQHQLHRRSLPAIDISDFNQGQSLDISGSLGSLNSDRHMRQSCNLSDFGILKRPNQDILGQECPPMSRSVRNTQEIPQTYTERLATFHNWPPYLRQRPRDLADAGFYYTGCIDCVRCPYCNTFFSEWESNDIPLEEHARHSPDCKFIQQCRQRQQDQDLENQQTTRETVTLDHIKHLDSLKEALDFSFNIDDILRAYNTLSQTLDIRDVTSTDILRFFFEADQEEEEAFSGDSCVCCMCCDRVVCVMFLPCRHGCCDECEHETEQCPYCSQYIKAVHRVYVG
ncbi:E3 ubiquitin-protein ligase XIAP-like [Saccostrea cucullata]|uniref:E3 ubiquitin-protein ligase XIAP-like n=1 Tax=Saccostrea cuccullata TaxID=36930 RepID=UPI002ED404DE